MKVANLAHVASFKDFKRVCRIRDCYGEWVYENMDQTLLYSEHRSWVYFIVVNGVIWKVGECGVPLGIRSGDSQPKKGTTNRLGRYRAMKGTYTYDTDEYCRNELRSTIANNNNLVEFWALQCPVVEQQCNLGYETVTLKAAFHCELEKRILNDIINATGSLPKLNKARA